MMLFALFIAVSLFSVSVRGSYYMETIIDESSSANFMGPANFGGIWVNSLGVVYFAKPSIQGVQTLTPAGNKTVIIGPSSQSTTGADGSATSVQLDGVYSITGDTSGSLYISSSQYFVWKYNQSSGIVSRYAGATPATQGYSGDGGQATAASFSYPRGLFLSSNGVLFVADTGNCRVRTINTTSEIINTFAGNGVNSFGGDSGPATSASLSSPSSVWGSSDGVIYISEIGNNRIRQVDTSGIITTFAGNGNQVYNTDNIPATSASFAVNSMSGDSNGTIFLADFSNFRILGIQSGIIHSIAGDGNNGGVMPAFISSNTSLPQPFYVFPDPVSGTVFFTGKATANVIVSALPTAAPTMTPTYTQTNTPTYNPTVHPTDTPTVTPTSAPSSHPTETPTFTPTSTPSFTLTEMPTVAPTFSPSVLPTETPTTTPTSAPSFHPTETPTMTPTSAPSFHPTDTPTITPSTVPSFRPSSSPTNSTLNSNSHSNERMSDLHIFYATFFPAFFVLCCILLGVLVYVSCYANGNVKNNETEQGKNVYEKVGGEGNGVVVRKERYYEVWI